MGYGYRWLAPRDAMYVEDAMSAVTCPIVRQMLGATTQNSGLYHGNGRKTTNYPVLAAAGTKLQRSLAYSLTVSCVRG